MAKYRVKFNTGDDDQIIEGVLLVDADKGSYFFKASGGDVVAAIPCDRVLSVMRVEE